MTSTASRATIPNAICVHEEDNAVAAGSTSTTGRGRGPPGPAARSLLPRHRRQLRIPRLLAVLPGRQHRVRGQGHRHHGHHAVAAGPARTNGMLVDERHLRALPPALHRGAPGPGRRRQDNTVYVTDSQPAAIGRPDNPYGLGLVVQQHPAAHRGRRAAGLRLEPPARLEGRERPMPGTGWVPTPATSSCPGAPSRRCSTPPRLRTSVPRSSGTRSGSRRTSPRSAGPAVTSRT